MGVCERLLTHQWECEGSYLSTSGNVWEALTHFLISVSVAGRRLLQSGILKSIPGAMSGRGAKEGAGGAKGGGKVTEKVTRFWEEIRV